MKTSFFKSIALVALLTFAILPAKLNAQLNTTCAYQIINQTGCDIHVDYRIISTAGPCAWVFTQLIGPCAACALNIPCADFTACGNGPWDVEVTITYYDYIPVTTRQTVSSANQGPLGWGPCASGVSAACCGSASFNITWTSSSTTIQ